MSADDAADLGRISTLRVSPGSTPPGDAVGAWEGRVLGGRYELLREIGRGGMGIVYEARHVTLQRVVAVKVLRPEVAVSTDALSRFEREARAAAAIGSPNIVEVIDFGRESSGEPWMVMERLDGEDLRARIRRRGRLGERETLAVMREVAAALRAAHAKGIVHRDLKSENVIVVERDGVIHAKVVDFGISKFVFDPTQSSMTAKDALLGTPHYMAPELADPDLVPDQRVDLYALGCIAYESLTGALPYAGRTAVEVLYQHAHAAVPSLRGRASVSPALGAIVRRLLAKRPSDRFPDAEALLAALDGPTGPRRRLALLAPLALLALVVAAATRWPRTAAPRGGPAPTRAASALATVDAATSAATIPPSLDAGVPAPTSPRVAAPTPTSERDASPEVAGRVEVPRAQRPRRAVRAAPPTLSRALDASVARPSRELDALRPNPYQARPEGD